MFATRKSMPNATRPIRFDREKFLSVVHYIIGRMSDDLDALGKTKLHKCLYYADMMKFVDVGEPLTGAEYRKAPFGPVARYLDWALKKLAEQGRVEVHARDYFGLRKIDFRSLKPSGSNLLNDYERNLLDDIVAFVCGFSAKEISEISHTAPWRLVSMGETIPYSSAYLLLPAEGPTRSDLKWAEELASRS